MMQKAHDRIVGEWKQSLEVSVEAQLNLLSSRKTGTVLLPYRGQQYIPLTLRCELPPGVQDYRIQAIYYVIPGGHIPNN
jgi:hypothetical protein